MSDFSLEHILEALLLAADEPLSIKRIQSVFPLDTPDKETLNTALTRLQLSYASRGIELKQLASGYVIQAKQDTAQYIARLWEERPAKYSRATLETLVIIAYRQPVTRGEIEDIRGVAVSSHIVKSLLEREWIKVLGHRDVPGRPAILGTTRQFLDYFNLKSLSDLPSLEEIKDIDAVAEQLELSMAEQQEAEPAETAQTVEPAEPADSTPSAELEHDESDASTPETESML